MPKKSDLKILDVPGLPEPMGHYAHAVRAGNLLFISGLLPLDAKGNVVGSDVLTQADQIFNLLTQILKAAGSDITAVVKLTTFLTDILDRAPLNAVRMRVFGAHKAASTLVEVRNLAVPGARIEMEAVAQLPST